MNTVGKPARPRQEVLWTRPYILMIIINLIFFTVHFILISVIPKFTLAIGGNESQIGLLTGVFTISALLGRPIFGRLLDTIGRRVILIAGALIILAVSLGYPWLTAILPLFLLRFIHGFGFSGFSTGSGTVVADLVPASRLSEGIGFFGLGNTLATAIGPALGLALIEKDFMPAFYLVSALSLIGFIGIFAVNYEKKRPPVIRAKTASAGKKNTIEKSTVKTFVVILFLSLAMGGVMSFLPIYGSVRHIENIGLFFTVNAVFLLLARFTTGRLADRIGFNQVLIPCILIGAAGFVILAFATSLWQVLVVAACYGLGFGAALPIMSAIMIKFCPPDQRGIANAVYFAAMDIGIGLGAVILGIISQYFGFLASYLLSASFVLTGLLAYMVLFYRKMKRGPATL